MGANECPKVSDSWRGGVSETCRLLGISANTLRKYAQLGRKNGGIEWHPNRAGRMRFSGKEIKRFWHERM